MAHIIRELEIPEFIRKEYHPEDAAGAPWLVNLSTLNVFIGVNNSGKSRLLRALFAAPELAYWSCTVPDRQKDAVRVLQSDLNSRLLRGHATQEGQIGRSIRQFQALMRRSDRETKYGALLWSATEIANLVEASERAGGRQPGGLSEWARNVRRVMQGTAGPISGSQPEVELKKIYIPTLRGLRPLPGTAHQYHNRTVADYFDGKQQGCPKHGTRSGSKDSLETGSILTGEELRDEVRSYLLGAYERREIIRSYEQYLSRTFFEGAKITLIPKEDGDVLCVRIGAEERPIYDLGDGIAQVIIMTLPLFLHRDKHLVMFIEEPELCLHPGFQRILIDTIFDESEVTGSRQVFVATHSNHFLDITLDQDRVSVFRFSQHVAGNEDKDERENGDNAPRFSIRNTSNEDFSLLAELGVRNSSVMLSNCTIWVEGITDRMYLRRYLKLHQDSPSQSRPRFTEDIHYSFVEYGGANIVHWSFLDPEEGVDPQRVCGKLFLIADKDQDKEDRHERLGEVLGDRYHVLKCREIENLLTPAVIKAVLHSYGEEDAALNNFGQEDYANEPLGEFIESQVLKAQKKRRGSYAAPPGTLNDKQSFARKALAHLNDISDMSEVAKNLTEQVYGFICKQNP
ncbi:MAG: ATP-binding protein [Phycisphaerales bacterium]|nr:ATP-binding protein [Phycisphaerales bacterium]